MLWFVFVIATTNLAVGYALGSGMQLPFDLPGLSFLRRKKDLSDLDAEDLLTRPAEPVEPVAEAKSSPPPAAPSVATDAEETPSPVEASPTEASPPSPEQMMAGLANLQQQLLAAGDSMKESVDTPEVFDESANRLQEASHEFLDQAKETIEVLDQAEGEGMAETRQAVSTSHDQVQELSAQFDGLLEEDLDPAKRNEILAKSEEVTTASGQPFATETPSDDDAEEPQDLGLPTDALFERIESTLATISETEKLIVAEMQLDPFGDQTVDADVVNQVSQDVAKLIDANLGTEQSFSLEGQRIMLLEGDSYEEASQRIEKIRQSVEATTYETQDAKVHATLTCSISEVPARSNLDEVRSQLSQALAESDRVGPNHTFHHDGAFSTPIEPIEVAVEPRSVKL